MEMMSGDGEALQETRRVICFWEAQGCAEHP